MKVDIKEAAQFYMDQGFRIVPLHPLSKGCIHEDKKRLTCAGKCIGKEEKIEEWPDATITLDSFEDGDNLALVMGKQLDGRWFLGIDIDDKLDLDKFIELPETLECSTAKGRHLIYEVEADSGLGNWNDIFHTRINKRNYKPGWSGAVDLKYCRGALVSPPSISSSGFQYEWKEWRMPARLLSWQVDFFIRIHKKNRPSVKVYKKWSMYPSHKGKKP